MTRIAFLVFFFLVFFCGCGARTAGTVEHPPAAPPPPSHRQLIVKFKAGTLPCTREGIARLSLESGVPLEFVRPMSGGACVVRQMGNAPDALPREETLLKRHPSIESLEPDLLMQPAVGGDR